MKKIAFIIAYFSLNICFCQNLYDSNNEKFVIRVKTIDEFIQRFNYEDSLHIEKNGFFKKRMHTREEFMYSLIKSEYILNDTLVANFIKDVSDEESPLVLDFYDKDWYAYADFNCIVDGQSVVMKLTLKLEIKSKGSKWVICGIDDQIDSFLDTSEYDSICVPPTNNEVYFIQLADIVNVNRELEAVIPKEFSQDRLFLFYKYCLNGRIKIGSCSKIEYYFLKDDRWSFKVSLIENKDDLQTGWLITEIIDLPINRKEFFKKQVLNIFDE